MSFDDEEQIGDLDWQDEEYNETVKKIKERMKMLYTRKVEEEKKKAIERAKKRKLQEAKEAKKQEINIQTTPQNAQNITKKAEDPQITSSASEYSTQDTSPKNTTPEVSKQNTTAQTSAPTEETRFALVIFDLDNLILDNYNRKMETYLELGWDKDSIHNFISKKENMYGKIASFNTNRVTFTASSRRNRFYEVYNREDMLEHDWQFPGVINSLKALAVDFDIYIVSERTEDLEEKTLKIMEKAGFPLDKIKVYFKKTHKVLRQYKKNCLVDITSKHPTGVGVILHPKDAQIFKRFNYTPVGFASIKDVGEFDGFVEVVCENWNQLTTCLKQD